MNPAICPHCGAEVPPDAKGCPECGSDEKTGWSDSACISKLELPGEEFDYGKFIEEEFDTGRVKPCGICWFWRIITLFLIGLSLILLLR